MICNLSTLMGKHKYSIQVVHEKTGLSRSTISSLYHDKASRIDFDTIEKLLLKIRFFKKRRDEQGKSCRGLAVLATVVSVLVIFLAVFAVLGN